MSAVVIFACTFFFLNDNPIECQVRKIIIRSNFEKTSRTLQIRYYTTVGLGQADTSRIFSENRKNVSLSGQNENFDHKDVTEKHDFKLCPLGQEPQKFSGTTHF